MLETHTKEYVEWMSNVWKMNDERNRRIEEEKRQKQADIDVQIISIGLWDE
jgi:acetoin utilization deacetylase AcuC-like enzyme